MPGLNHRDFIYRPLSVYNVVRFLRNLLYCWVWIDWIFNASAYNLMYNRQAFLCVLQWHGCSRAAIDFVCNYKSVHPLKPSSICVLCLTSSLQLHSVPCSVEGSFTFPMQKKLYLKIYSKEFYAVVFATYCNLCNYCFCHLCKMHNFIWCCIAVFYLRFKSSVGIQFGLLNMYIKTAHSSCRLVTYRFLFAVKQLSVRQC